MYHPPYSPYLAPCDFWLFPKLKNALKGQTFADLPDIQTFADLPDIQTFADLPDIQTFADLPDIQSNVKNVTSRYSRKQFSRLFPSVAPSSHEVHSFTRRVFRRRQQLLVHR